jgi:hypothetical protein
MIHYALLPCLSIQEYHLMILVSPSQYNRNSHHNIFSMLQLCWKASNIYNPNMFLPHWRLNYFEHSKWTKLFQRRTKTTHFFAYIPRSFQTTVSKNHPMALVRSIDGLTKPPPVTITTCNLTIKEEMFCILNLFFIERAT